MAKIKILRDAKVENVVQSSKLYSNIKQLVFTFFIEEADVNYKLVSINGIDILRKETREPNFYDFSYLYNNPGSVSQISATETNVSSIFESGLLNFTKIPSTGDPYIMIRRGMQSTTGTASCKLPYSGYTEKSYTGYCLWVNINNIGTPDFTLSGIGPRLLPTLNLKFQFNDDLDYNGNVPGTSTEFLPTLSFCNLTGIKIDGSTISYPAGISTERYRSIIPSSKRSLN